MKHKLFLACAFLLGFTSISKAQSTTPFIGQIMFVPFTYAPQGWHDCDGALLPISENDALYALIGTTYGGDGQNTFALPDARGRVIISDGQGPGLSPRIIGETGGSETVTLTTQQLPIHNHNINANISAGNTSSPTGALPANTRKLDKEYTTDTLDTTMNQNAVQPSGGSQPHNNMMPSTTLKCVIALEGIFPTQG